MQKCKCVKKVNSRYRTSENSTTLLYENDSGKAGRFIIVQKLKKPINVWKNNVEEHYIIPITNDEVKIDFSTETLTANGVPVTPCTNI
jgi:hypothetical protein